MNPKIYRIGMFVALTVASSTAIAQSNDVFKGAKRFAPADGKGVPFFAYVTSHDGKFVLSNSTRVKATAVKNGARVDDGVARIPPLDWGFSSYQLDYIGSQVPGNINRVYIKQLTGSAPADCRPCYTIHRTIEHTRGLDGDQEWVLGTVASQARDGTPWQGVYLSGKEVYERGTPTKFLAPGTPVWQRLSSGQLGTPGPRFRDQYPRLVLKPTGNTSTNWQIAELDGSNKLTGKVLSNNARPNQVFTYANVVRDTDWDSYTLVDGSNAGAGATFEVRRPLGNVASVGIGRDSESFVGASMFNLDSFVTIKSASAFAGMAGIAFNLNAKPLNTLGQRFTYPGFVAFVPQLPEGIVMQGKSGTFHFPRGYSGTFSGVLFGIRGATGDCSERGLLAMPTVDGIGLFPEFPQDKISNWMICARPLDWKTGQRYKVRLWTIGKNPRKQRKWGAWVSKPDGTESQYIGSLTIPEDEYGNAAPQIVSARAFVHVQSPQACDKVQSMEMSIDKVVGDNKATALVLREPNKITCSGLGAFASCTGGTCNLGAR